MSGSFIRATTPFEPVQVGALQLQNRIVMAPMTRSRAFGTLASEDMAEYYSQRAGAGLIVTEGVQPSAVGQGYPDTPGLHTPEQIAAWRTVTDRAHAAGGTIVAQLMHTGRIGHPDTTDAVGNPGLRPVGASPVTAEGQIFTPTGRQAFVEPTPLTENEILSTVSDFAAAARNAIDAGFDGVEVHAANGYLLHQFLAPNANQRTDQWGGSVKNRIRLSVAVVEAVAHEIGADRTGVRISPNNGLGDTHETDYQEVYPALVTALDALKLAYLHLIEAGDITLTPKIRALWHSTLILNPADPDTATHAARLDRIKAADTDMVSFGRLFIANPDLVSRLRNGVELAQPDLSKAYGGGAVGYTDYPRATTN